MEGLKLRKARPGLTQSDSAPSPLAEARRRHSANPINYLMLHPPFKKTKSALFFLVIVAEDADTLWKY